ncbi:hypothetical protein [Thiohalophilus sp.]|uniref:hypothetical protein n=1 Tax=Thiohalophilus sp. TaxID=3028392 RepID=UPI002ACE05D2|nr:hypothetical protein [Thiohalophilus sp.]MDZ7803486.1 hypothetical protein [Thiohalophilus sp.]
MSNDRYGIYPLYYACHDNAIHISPSIHHVLKGNFPKTLDTAALAVFYRLGFFIGEDTPFEQIRILPPGSRLSWQQGRMQLERGSIETPAPSNEVRSFDEAVEQYADLFEQAITRCPPAEDDFTPSHQWWTGFPAHSVCPAQAGLQALEYDHGENAPAFGQRGYSYCPHAGIRAETATCGNR